MNSIKISFRTSLYLLLTALLAACINYSNPDAVALAYVDAVYSGEVEDFKKLIQKKHYESTQDYKLFIQGESTGRLLTQAGRGGIIKTELVKSTITEQRAFIKIDVTFDNNQVKNLSINLRQSDGRWYVDPMSWARW